MRKLYRLCILIAIIIACGTLASAQNTFCPQNGNCNYTGNNTWAGTSTFNGAVTFNAAVNGLPNAGSCTNQFVRALNNSAGPTCATVNMGADITGLMPLANLVSPTGTGFVHITAGAIDSASKLVSLTSDTIANQGTATTLLHGNAAGQPSFGSVVSADLNITPTTCTNQFVSAVSATGTATCTTDTLASAQHANQGTTVTVLHGNAAGNPSFAVVTPSDAAGNTSGSGNFALVNTPVLTTPNIGAATGVSVNLSGSVTAGTTLAVTGVSTLTGGASVGSFSRDCRQDGTIDTTGAVDASAVINTCIANAKTNKQSIVQLPCGNILLTASTLNGTNFPGLRITGCGWQAAATNPPTQSQGVTNLWCNQGTSGICIDFTGSSAHELDHLILTLFKSGLTGSAMGVLQARDNSGGGGSANPLCFTENFNIHDVYITDNGASSLTLNSNRGFVGIYNVSAENGVYNNFQILADTTMVFSQNNVLGTVSPYQTIQTGCPLSMTGVVMENPVLGSSSTTLPVIEANTTEGFRITGIQGLNGAALIKFENTSGSSATDSWTVTGLYEQGASDIINPAVNLDNMDIYILIAIPPPGFDIKMGANNLTLSQSRFIFDSTPATVPFIDNVSTGTAITGSTINIGAATSASNTTVTSSTVYAPGVTDANITFNAASNYDRFTSSGISTVGTRKASQYLASSNGTLAAPALGITSSASGWFMSSNTIWQNTYGGTAGAGFTAGQFIKPVAMVDCWSSNADPNNAACDTGISRDAAGVTDFGTGAAGSAAGSIKLTKEQLVEAAAPAGIASQQVVFGDSGDHMLKYNPNNAGEQHVPLRLSFTSNYTNATTTFSTITNMSFPVNASQTYTIDCMIPWQASATTAGPKFQLTGPASPTAVTLMVDGGTGASAFADAVATAFSSAVTAFGTAGATGTNFIVHVHGFIANGTNAGTVALQAAANGAGTLTIIPTDCRVQ